MSFILSAIDINTIITDANELKNELKCKSCNSREVNRIFRSWKTLLSASTHAGKSIPCNTFATALNLTPTREGISFLIDGASSPGTSKFVP
jgi:hypothetical protein